MLQYLPIEDIYPFDSGHWQIDEPPGFAAKKDKVPNEHFNGALEVERRVRQGATIWPIAVCRMELVPARKRAGKPYQRLDGFKRYMGQKMAGVTEILCDVRDKYEPGCQEGHPMTVEADALALSRR